MGHTLPSAREVKNLMPPLPLWPICVKMAWLSSFTMPACPGGSKVCFFMQRLYWKADGFLLLNSHLSRFCLKGLEEAGQSWELLPKTRFGEGSSYETAGWIGGQHPSQWWRHFYFGHFCGKGHVCVRGSFQMASVLAWEFTREQRVKKGFCDFTELQVLPLLGLAVVTTFSIIWSMPPTWYFGKS